MAIPTDKEKFFAQLDGLDESTETESASDLEYEIAQKARRKRQRLSSDSKSHILIPVPEKVAKPSDHKQVRDDMSSPQPKPPVLRCALTDQTAHEDKSAARDNRQKTVRRTKSALASSKGVLKPVHKLQSNDKKRLFDKLTFYFIPNDDVSKPRKLRIQSAIAQGATWARKLGPEVTHVIVDPEITAPAVLKYVKDQVNIAEVAFVRMSWVIECLSHKSVRIPTDSRFQLKGASAAFADFLPKPSVDTVSIREAVTDSRTDTKPKDSNTSIANTGDELDQIVQSMKTAEDLPFDVELDLNDLLSFTSEDEQEDKRPSRPQRAASNSKSFPDDQADELQDQHGPDPRNAGYQCMQANPTAQVSTPNDRTIAILQQMATYYDRTGDSWRTLAYRRAMTALRKQTVRVTTAKQARAIHGIGTRLADKIEEIAITDRLKRLEAIQSDPDDVVLQLFMGVYGAGLRQARTWMEQGYRTLDDLLENAKLSTNQKIGIEHHQDFAQRIPRAEVKQHGDIVGQALKVADRDLQYIIGGSYRRGMPDSGDIDVIITHPTATLSQLQTWVFDIVVPHLTKIGFMKCALATSRPKVSTSTLQRPSRSEANSLSNETQDLTVTGSKFLGASQLPPSSSNPSPLWRRIDLLLVPPTSIGAALIYFTGNDIFNRSIRLLASKKGMRLNQHGLYCDVMRGKGRVKITEGEFVEGRSEKKIFEILGVPWREATERRC